ncbi:DUF1439 domain-containing protein [Lysobacter solisilvae (ex Woo and Kim 2020)]|uniref:DUF1439 domain-containing protein n=1 Tax=Agrilutibacter terrestris TaxID=2865112 RepID=A0A7H0FYL9_9GAMM|nr:DUF1439 domain-containing protein [Lysobacter terrestris]QNP41135.1 DUF1439 domain-containing protein [Lysobacter terrestris]
MNPRRRFLATVLATSALLGSVLAASGCSTLGAVTALLGNQVNFTQPQLQQSLNRNFPKHYDKLGGLVSMTLLNPRLSIPQGSNRLRLDFDLGIGALGSDSSRPSGHFALTSALRFDPTTRGLHLQDPAIEQVNVPSLGGMMNSSARGLLNDWLAGYARDEPVYRFDNSLLDRLGSRRIGRTDIEDGQVVVHLGDN